jgi:hypothetical protein
VQGHLAGHWKNQRQGYQGVIPAMLPSRAGDGPGQYNEQDCQGDAEDREGRADQYIDWHVQSRNVRYVIDLTGENRSGYN